MQEMKELLLKQEEGKLRLYHLVRPLACQKSRQAMDEIVDKIGKHAYNTKS